MPSQPPILMAIIYTRSHYLALYTSMTVWQYSVVLCVALSLPPSSLVCITFVFTCFHPKHMSIFSIIYFVRFRMHLEAGFLSMIKLPVLYIYSVWIFFFCQNKHFVVCTMNLSSLRCMVAMEPTFLFSCTSLLPFWGKAMWVYLLTINMTVAVG